MSRRSQKELCAPEIYYGIDVEQDIRTQIEDPDHRNNKDNYTVDKWVKIAPKRVIHVYRSADHILWFNAKQNIWCKYSNYDMNKEMEDDGYAQIFMTCYALIALIQPEWLNFVLSLMQ